MMTAISPVRSTIPRASQYGRVNLPRTVRPLLRTTRAFSCWSSDPAQVHQDKTSDVPSSVVSDGSAAPETSEKSHNAAASALDKSSPSAPSGAPGALQKGSPVTIWKSSQAAAPRIHRKLDEDDMPRSEAYASWLADICDEAPRLKIPRSGPPQPAAPRAVQGQSLRTEVSRRAPLYIRDTPQPHSLVQRPNVAPGTKQYFRFARLFGLHPDTTLVDIVRGIMKTAPVGRVLSVAWEAEGRLSLFRGQQVRAAYVLFDHDASPVELRRLAEQRIFRVADTVVHVSVYKKRAFHGNVDGAEYSRVLSIHGPRDVQGFSEDAIRELLLGNESIAKALGPLQLDAEWVETIDWGNTLRSIQWRFLSNEKQARVVLPILRRYFNNELSILPGADPCWNEGMYPRKSTPYYRHLSGVSEANKMPGYRTYYRPDGVKTLPTQEMIRSDPEDLNRGSDLDFDVDQPFKNISHEPDKVGHDAARKENTMHVEDDVEDPTNSRTEDDWEDDGDDPTQQRIKELLAPYRQPDQLKPLDSTQRDRIEDWARLKRTMEKRYEQK